MYTQAEGDFWKEKLILMQRQSLRLNPVTLNLSDAEKNIENIKKLFPQMEISENTSSSYISADFQASKKLKIRLYIQNQIKITFLEEGISNWEKIADAKFLNDPFPLLIHFLNHIKQYEEELKNLLGKQKIIEKKQKIAAEFIKASLKKKFKDSQILWNLQINQENFTLILEKDRDSRRIPLSFENFPSEIENIQI